MSRDIRVAILFAMAIAVGVAAPAPGAKKPTYSRNNDNRNSSVNRAKQAADQARQNLSKAQQQLSQARQQAAAADNKADRESHQLDVVRQAVQREHNSAPGLQNARRDANDSRAQFEELRKPVLEKLAETRAYQDAVAERDRLNEQLQKLPAAPTEYRRQLEHNHALAVANVHGMEKAALDADPALRRARESLEADEREVRARIQKRDVEISQDSRLNQAMSEASRAHAAEDAARQKLAAEARQLANARQNYAQKSANIKRVQSRNSPNKRRR